jgi:F0F1-type ATP synthase assembly protein I
MPDHSELPGGSTDERDEVRLSHHIPEPPRLNPKLPEHPEKAKQSESAAATYSNSAIATSAVSSFVTPIVVLCLAGYWLDQRMKHKTPWFSMAGVIVGLVLGTSSLMRVLNRLSK